MFRKLRWKLALTNAAVAAVILLAISIASYVIISGIVGRQSQQDLSTITRDLITADYSGGNTPFTSIQIVRSIHPYFFIRIDQDGRMSVANFGTTLTRDQMSELVSKALDNESKNTDIYKVSEEGQNITISVMRSRKDVVRLSDGHGFRYNIRGLRVNSTTAYLVFLDMTYEETLLRNVLLALIACVLGGLVLTFGGGLFLAGRSLRPIKAAWQKQRDFVADASHELRSPLAAIRCNLDVVLDDPAVPVGDKQPFWEGIVEETDRMSKLVEELLLLARADSGAITLQRERVQLADVAASAISFMGPLAAKKGVGLRFDSAGAPVVLGDQARLKQVLIALIDNAVKYTPEGGSVTVRVKNGKDKAVVEVEDTGIGISKDDLAKIFDRFYRVDSARSRETGGHGLGLSIAQWIVQQLGGAITAASEEQKGSCFTVQLPLLKE